MRKILVFALGLVALVVSLPGKALAASPAVSLVVNDENPLGPELVGEVLIGSELAIKNQEVQTNPVDTIVLSSADETKGAESASTNTDVATKRVGFLKIGAGPLRL